MNKNIKTALQFIAFLSLGVGIFYLVYSSQNTAYQEECILKGIAAEDCNLIQKVIADFKSVKFFWIAVIVIAFMISNISRAIRWQMLLHPLGYRPRFINSFLTIMLGYLANLGLPRIGEVVRAGTFAKYESISVERVIGTVVVGRIIDVIFLLLFIGLAILLEFNTIWGFIADNAEVEGLLNNNKIWLAGIVFFVIIISLYLFRKKIKQSFLYKKIEGILIGFVEGLQTVRRLDRPGLFVWHSINIWLMYFLMAYLGFFAFEPTAHLGMSAGLVIFVFGAFGIVIPSPGGMGTYHFLVISGLALYGIAADDAFSFANIIFFSINIFCNAAFGILALILLPLINKNYQAITVRHNEIIN